MDKAGTVHAVFWVRAVPGPAPTPPPVRPIVYRQSTDFGKTWSAPVDVDPGNVSAGHPPLLAADPKTSDLYMAWNANAEIQNTVPGYAGDLDLFAWQDTRNALGESGSEDIYTSSVPLAPVVLSESDSGIPGWTLLLTGLFGLGVGVVVAWALFRRREGEPAARPAPARA